MEPGNASRPRGTGKWRSSGRAIRLLSVLVTVIIGATAGFAVWHNRRSALAEHRRAMRDMGVVLAEQTARHAQVIDLTLRMVQARIARLGLAGEADFRRQLGTEEINAYLAEQVRSIPQTAALVLMDANGLSLNWSRAWPLAHLDASARDFYTHFRDHDDPSLFIGSLSKSQASGELSLFFARRVGGPGGEFLGLILGVVDVKQLVDFYQTAGGHSGQAVTLLRRDGTMLIRYPNPETAIGVKLPPQSPWYARVAQGGAPTSPPVPWTARRAWSRCTPCAIIPSWSTS